MIYHVIVRSWGIVLFQSDVKSLDFAVARFLTKLFRTVDPDYCICPRTVFINYYYYYYFKFLSSDIYSSFLSKVAFFSFSLENKMYEWMNEWVSTVCIIYSDQLCSWEIISRGIRVFVVCNCKSGRISVKPDQNDQRLILHNRQIHFTSWSASFLWYLPVIIRKVRTWPCTCLLLCYNDRVVRCRPDRWCCCWSPRIRSNHHSCSDCCLLHEESPETRRQRVRFYSTLPRVSSGALLNKPVSFPGRVS